MFFKPNVMAQTSVAAVIPAFNEEKTVSDVVDAVLKSKLFKKVICVDDGSDDNTQKILKSFGASIKLISFRKNKGKAAAMAAGVRESKTKLVMFIDADLVGLKTTHIKKIYSTLIKSKVDAVLGTLDNELIERLVVLRGSPYGKGNDELTGERIYYRKDLLPHLNRIGKLGYGVETYLNNAFKHKKVKFVKLRKLDQLMKQQKRGWNYKLVKEVVKQSGDIVKEIASQKLDLLRRTD